jgi:hypothetical protein
MSNKQNAQRYVTGKFSKNRYLVNPDHGTQFEIPFNAKHGITTAQSPSGEGNHYWSIQNPNGKGLDFYFTSGRNSCTEKCPNTEFLSEDIAYIQPPIIKQPTQFNKKPTYVNTDPEPASEVLDLTMSPANNFDAKNWEKENPMKVIDVLKEKVDIILHNSTLIRDKVDMLGYRMDNLEKAFKSSYNPPNNSLPPPKKRKVDVPVAKQDDHVIDEAEVSEDITNIKVVPPKC